MSTPSYSFKDDNPTGCYHDADGVHYLVDGVEVTCTQFRAFERKTAAKDAELAVQKAEAK